MLKERLATLKAIVTLTTQDYDAGRVPFDRVHQATKALLDAELELAESAKARIVVLEKIVALAKGNEKAAQALYLARGMAQQSDVLRATLGRLEAEIVLERAKSKLSAKEALEGKAPLPAIQPDGKALEGKAPLPAIEPDGKAAKEAQALQLKISPDGRYLQVGPDGR